MKERKNKMAQCVLNSVEAMIRAGLTWEEGRIAFAAAAAVMEQIDKTPEASDDALCDLIDCFIDRELATQAVGGMA